MFGWLVWASLLSLSNQDMNGQDNGVIQCRPQNVKVDTLTEKQRISLTWEDGPSCARIHEQLIYEVEVRIDNKQVLLDDVVVLPNQTGIAHSWNWTSPLPLECASHSVRLRSKYQNHTSEWSHLQTIPGKNSSDETQVFPNDRVVEVGSNFTFCCILGAESTFEQMKFRQYSKTQMTTTKISDRIYTMTAHLHTPSPPAATDVFCNSNRYAASVFIGYPPGDMNLTCETRDLESVECHWSKGRDTHLYARRATYYLLNGSHCNTVGCTNKICKCNQNVQVDVGEKNWTLRAQNPLGVVEITDKADLSKRVHMFAPEKVTTSSVNARNVSLRWQWTVQKYNTLHLECQVRLSYSGRTDTRNVSGFGLTFTVLNGLIPKQKYTVQIQCGTKRHFWKTGDWSENCTFETKEENALDVWMQLKNNQTIITWKTPSANQIHGQIEGYEVTWGSTTEKERQKKTVLPSLNSIGLSLDASKEHIVTVTARTSNGSSLPSSITVTGFYPEINSSKITGSNGGFDLSWSPSPAASCGYVVDWCPTFGECSVEWTTVPVGVTKARIVSEREPFGPLEFEEEECLPIGKEHESQPSPTEEKWDCNTRNEETESSLDSKSISTSHGNSKWKPDPTSVGSHEHQSHLEEHQEEDSVSSSPSNHIKAETDVPGAFPVAPTNSAESLSSLNPDCTSAQSETSDIENADDLWCCAVWRAGSREVEGVVPSTWIRGKKVLWPPANGRLAVKERHKPGPKWTTYNLVKVKLFSDSLEECEGHCMSSEEVTDNDSDSEPRKSRKRRRKKRMIDEDKSTGPEQTPCDRPSSCEARPQQVVSTSPPVKKRAMTADETGVGSLSKSSADVLEPPMELSEATGLCDSFNDDSYHIAGPESSDAWEAVFSTAQPRRAIIWSGQGMMGSVLNSTAHFPLPNGQFQEKVLGLLMDIHHTVKNLGSRVGILEQTDLQFDVCRTIEEMVALEKAVEPPEVAAQMKQFLSRIGGKTLRDNVARVMERLMTNELMSNFNMKGKGNKKSFLATGLSRIIIDSVMLAHPYATESAVTQLIANVLKHAPDRPGGGGRPKQRIIIKQEDY